MPPKTPNIQLLGETLTRHYRLSCELYNTYPIGRYTHQFSQGKLEVNLADIDLDHLEALCHTLQNKVTPLLIFLYKPLGSEAGVKTIQRAIRGISVGLSMSMTVSEFSVSNVSLRGNNLTTLCQGLSKSRCLKIISLRGCELGSSGTELLCQSIKNVPSITHLALTHCSISEKGSIAVANLVQHQRMNRDSAMWQDTLRLRQPHLDGMRGLRRITLNDNPQIGDAGITAMANVLMEDLWIKALDLQHCGLSGESGTLMKAVLKTNQVLEIVDLRRNPFIPNHLVNEVTAILSERQDEYAEQQYIWLDLGSLPASKQEGKTNEVKARTYATTGRTRIRETRGKAEDQGTVKKPSIPRQYGIPWRVEHRLYERKEGMAPGTLVETNLSAPKEIILEEEVFPHQPSEESSVNSHKIIKKLGQYKKRLKKERKLRKRAEKKLSRLKAKIKKSHILDEATVTHIETCFQKFQIFLTHLQNLGLQMQLQLPEFEMENNENKFLLSSLHPQANSVQNTQYSDLIHTPEMASESFQPSDDSNSRVLLNGPSKADVAVQDPEINATISTEEEHEHITSGPSEKGLAPENRENMVKLSTNKTQNSAISELSEAINKGTNMLSLLPRGEALDELDQNYESEASDDDEDEVSCNEDEEDISPGYGAVAHDIKEPELIDKDEDIYIEYEENVNLAANIYSEKSEQSFVSSEANLETSSDSRGLALQIHGVEDLYAVPNEVVTGEKAHMLSHIGDQNVAVDSPLPVNQAQAEHSNTREEAEGMTDKEIVSRNPEYSYPKNSASGRYREIVSDEKPRREIPTHDYAGYAEYANRKAVYRTEDIVDMGPSNEVSETDDEKLRMRQTTFNWSGRSGSISSSLSITEQLSHSHNRWSKAKGEGKQNDDKQEAETGKLQRQRMRDMMSYPVSSDKIQVTLPLSGRLQREPAEVDYDSDFEVSDVEGVSISASSLTSTSIPDDLVTPGEEDF